jgi:inner membrane protein
MEPNGKPRQGAFSSMMRKNGVLIKLIIIGVLLLVLLVPLSLVNSLVREREDRRNQAAAEIINAWGGEQTVGGPFLTVPYIHRSKDGAGRETPVIMAAYFLPDTLAFDGRLDPQIRSKGIYEATLYTTRLSVKGTFEVPDFSGWQIAAGDILWDQAALSLELPDMRGLRERVHLAWGEAGAEFRSGKGSVGLFGGEIVAAVPGLAPAGSRGLGAGGAAIPFSFTLALQGGGSLSLIPLGDETTVTLSSPWKSPSFTGMFLPARRTLSDAGFQAEWKVTSMARAYPQRWRAGDIEPDTVRASAFTAGLMTPVDTYLKTTRALKYGILFLIFPFCALFLFEVFSGQRVHPLQYLFIGLADCVFYLLLLSLSEHIGFSAAYAAGSVATCALATAYTCAVTGSWRKGVFILPVLAATYGFLAVVLQSEDYALLIGSVGLFVILAAVMFFTRRVDWYGVDFRRGDGSDPR